MSNDVPRGDRMICLTLEQFQLLRTAWEDYRARRGLGDGYQLKEETMRNATIDLRRKVSEPSYQQLELAPPAEWLEKCPLDFSGCKGKLGFRSSTNKAVGL